jgi:hypothetical protein
MNEIVVGAEDTTEYPEMSMDEFMLLFHKLELNRVAFKSVVNARWELYKLVCMAMREDRKISWCSPWDGKVSANTGGAPDKVSSDEVLHALQGKMSTVVVIGYDKTGSECYVSNERDKTTIASMLVQARKDLDSAVVSDGKWVEGAWTKIPL